MITTLLVLGIWIWPSARWALGSAIELIAARCKDWWPWADDSARAIDLNRSNEPNEPS